MAELVKFEPGHGIDHGWHFTPSQRNDAVDLIVSYSSNDIVISAVSITVQYDVTIPALAPPDACDPRQKSARLY
jgi:hypothetical protein